MSEVGPTIAPADLVPAVAADVRRGRRLAALVALAEPDDSTSLLVVLAGDSTLEVRRTELPPGVRTYPAISVEVPSAAWYEREIHDLFGLVAQGTGPLEPVVLPRAPASPHPMSLTPPSTIAGIQPKPAERARGEGVFTLHYGPVRSGVFESIQYLVETVGEEIPHLGVLVHHKHRGLEQRFSQLAVPDAVLLAERVEGTAAVAHALAFSQAIEELGGVSPPRPAGLLRVVHAELERIATHLDSVIRHTEGAGQAVANARMSVHKERILRLRAQLCGHRFGRGVVIPGGTTGPPLLEPTAALAAVAELETPLRADLDALMATPSFLDRLAQTGWLDTSLAAAHGALGPVGRGSGVANDVRGDRPYAAYPELGFVPATATEGDALARQQIRVEEIEGAVRLIRLALVELAGLPDGPWSVPVRAQDGTAIASVEAPQGELLYVVRVDSGRLIRVKPRTASFHNLGLLPRAFAGDIFTDFVFIEASFGLSPAGVAL